MAEIGVVPGGGLPFGDIVKAQTPFTDQVTAQLLAQQQDRRQYQQKMTLQTDELMNKELANVRSVDMGSVMDSYGKWKNISMQMLNPRVQSNPRLYNDLQQQKNALLGQTMGLISRSSQYNALGKQIGTNLQSRPDYYSDDAGKMLTTFYNTPMDQLTAANYNGKPVDLTDAQQYRYSGGIDLSGLHAKAKGKDVTHYDNGTTDASGVQTTQHGYTYGNTPLEYRNSYLPGLAGNQANRTARSNWAQHSTQQELDELDAAYQNSPNWKILGMAPQQLPAYNPNDPVGNEATYQAKKYLVAMNPAEVKAAATTNQAAKMTLQAGLKLHGQEVMATINEGNKEKFAALQHNYKRADASDQARILEETYGSIVSDARQAKPHFYLSPDRKSAVKIYPMKLSATMKTVLSLKDDKGHPIYPDYVGVSDDGKNIYPMYTEGEEVDNKKDVDVKLSQPVTSAEFKALLGKTLYGVKEAVKETSKPGASGIHWEKP